MMHRAACTWKLCVSPSDNPSATRMTMCVRRVVRDYFRALGAGNLIEVAGWDPNTSNHNPPELQMDAQKLHFLLGATRLLVCLLRDRSLHLKKVTALTVSQILTHRCPRTTCPAAQQLDATCN